MHEYLCFPYWRWAWIPGHWHGYGIPVDPWRGWMDPWMRVPGNPHPAQPRPPHPGHPHLPIPGEPHLWSGEPYMW